MTLAYNKKKVVTCVLITCCIFVSMSSLSLFAQNYHGMDVSHHQHKIEWSKVAEDDVDFVYIKATEGATYKDPCYDENMKGAIDAGLPAGAYHFFRMTSSATAQFNNFRAALKGTYTIWQYTETGHVKGILKPVDRCVFNSRYGLKDIERNIESRMI